MKERTLAPVAPIGLTRLFNDLVATSRIGAFGPSLLKTTMNKCVLPMVAILAGFPFLTGCAAEFTGNSASQPAAPLKSATHEMTAPAWPRYVLRADRTWQLNLPGGQEFDASGLAIT